MIEFTKKGFKKIICCAMAFSTLSLNVGAEDFYSNIEFKDNVVTYRGVSGIYPSKIVNALVVEGDKQPSDDNIIGINAAFTEEDGVYVGEIYLSPDIEPGIYTIYVNSEFGKTTKKFIIPDENAVETILSTLNKKTNSLDFELYLKNNSEKLGIIADDYVNSYSFVSKVLFSLKPEDGYKSAQEVSSQFVYNDIVYSLINSSDISKSINEYADALLVDKAEYNNLEEDVKKIVNELLKNEDYTKTQFTEIYEKNIAFADIKTADRWATQKEKVLKYAERIGIDLEGTYSLLDDKDAVFQELFKKDVNSLDDTVENFNSIVDDCYQEEKRGSGSGSGSGTSGGGFSIPISAETKEENKTEFSDITGHWAYSYITRLINDGSINGYQDGTFRPNNTITRAEFTKIIVEVFDIVGEQENQFIDVDENAWYFKYINTAGANSIIFGSNNCFYPNDFIKRQDAAVIIHRILMNKNIDMAEVGNFSDEEVISQYAKDAVKQLAGIGIINGNQGKFLPNNYITRAETAKMIASAMDLI